MGNVFPSFLHKACHKLTFLQNFGINNSSILEKKVIMGEIICKILKPLTEL